MKALFVNGSPRRNFNTAQLLERAMQGARDAGAECEMVHLYDRGLNYKGCMSCFACKLKGGRKGVCSYPDSLKPVLEHAVEADVLVCGSPVYCGYPTAGMRAFMERLIFPAVNYSDYNHPIVNHPKRSASIYTMNCPDEECYRANAYDTLMDVNACQLGIFGPTEIFCCYDTWQFNDYSRYDAARFDAEHKAEVHRTRFVQDMERAYNIGKTLCQSGM